MGPEDALDSAGNMNERTVTALCHVYTACPSVCTLQTLLKARTQQEFGSAASKAAAMMNYAKYSHYMRAAVW